MTKAGLIMAVAKKTGKSQREIASVIDTMIKEMTNTLAGNEKVVLPGFGTFVPYERLPYDYYSPQAKAHRYSPKVYRVKFRMGAILKDKVAQIPIEKKKK